MEWTRWELEVAGIMMPALEVMMVAAILFLLASTLVRVVVRLVVGGALAPYSPRDPFADNAWGVLVGGGCLGNHCKDVCLVYEVEGSGGGTCVDSDGGFVCSAERVPDPGDEQERRTSTGSGDASVVNSGDGHCLDYYCGDPCLGRGSPRGGRGPSFPLASRPVRGQRLGSVEGWGGLRNHCEDVGRCGNGHDGLDGGLDDVVVHGVKGIGVGFSLSFVTWNCASLLGHAPGDEIGRKRYRSKIDKVVGLAMSHDVAFLQEVHGCEGDLSSLGCYIPNHLLCGSLCPSKAAGGVLTIVHPRLRQRYGDCWSMRTILRGQATVVDLADYREGSDVIGGRHGPLSLCC